jgi:hypothetical protein
MSRDFRVRYRTKNQLRNLAKSVTAEQGQRVAGDGDRG